MTCRALAFAMRGPIVRDISTSFDRYWNSPSAYPMESLDPEGVSDKALASLRERLAGRTAGAGGGRHGGARAPACANARRPPRRARGPAATRSRYGATTLYGG